MKKFCFYRILSIASIVFLPSLGHGLGQNAFSKIWLNFLARKVQEKAPKSSDFGVFYGGQYRTRTCDPMHVKSYPFVFYCILIIIRKYFR